MNNTQYIEIDGVNLRYMKVGNGDPLVLIHTLRTQLDYFQKVIPSLAEHFEVYALDLPGHGHSDIPSGEYTQDFLTGFVEEFLFKLNLHDVTLVGESIGGVIALSIASRGKASVKRVISLNPYDYGNGGGIRRSSFLAKIVFAAIQWPVIGWVVSHSEAPVLRTIMEGGFCNKEALPEDLVNEFRSVGSRKGYRRAERSLFRNWKSWVEAKGEYDKVRVPVTLVYGDSDWSHPQEREANHRRIPGSQLITLKDTSHFSSLENPEAIINNVLENSPEGLRQAVKTNGE
jgi:pimeloyl-ACP methyl ester carboxylesterase